MALVSSLCILFLLCCLGTGNGAAKKQQQQQDKGNCLGDACASKTNTVVLLGKFPISSTTTNEKPWWQRKQYTMEYPSWLSVKTEVWSLSGVVLVADVESIAQFYRWIDDRYSPFQSEVFSAVHAEDGLSIASERLASSSGLLPEFSLEKGGSEVKNGQLFLLQATMRDEADTERVNHCTRLRLNWHCPSTVRSVAEAWFHDGKSSGAMVSVLEADQYRHVAAAMEPFNDCMIYSITPVAAPQSLNNHHQ